MTRSGWHAFARTPLVRFVVNLLNTSNQRTLGMSEKRSGNGSSEATSKTIRTQIILISNDQTDILFTGCARFVSYIEAYCRLAVGFSLRCNYLTSTELLSKYVSNLFIECDKRTHTLLKYYDKGMCSNNIQHNMTEFTKQQHTTNKEIKKYKIKHKKLANT